MAPMFTRRDTLRLTAAGIAAMALPGSSGAQVPRADVAAPKLPIENGASLRVLRPARFVEPDETIFRANTAKFQQTTGVETRVDFVGWEDIRQQTAVASNTGTGPDIVIGWADDPHVYVDKIVELSDVAEYLGKRYGGWSFLGEKYGKRDKTNNWIGIPFGGTTGPIVYRRSAVKEAGFDKIPNDHAEYLKLCQALKKLNKPAGFALGNAVGDGNGFAQWLIWSHGGYLLDEAGKVAINSKETVAALTYLKDLYPTFVSGTLSWGDPSNNRAYAAGDCWLTANGVSLYFALKNDPAQRAIAEDTDHQAAAVRRGRQRRRRRRSMLNAMLFRHSKYPNAAKSYIQFMMEAGAVRPMADRLPRLLVAHPARLREERRVGLRSEARGLSERHRPSVLERLQGADHASLANRRGRIRPGADVCVRRLGRGDAAGGGARGRATVAPVFPRIAAHGFGPFDAARR